ncbi:MAG: DUF4153 domain-containing protein [Candidatus Delongbacteria bacterium]|nr:DUF4153 domain-containing protein [Candidatus Delongbacteria bacterium]
MNLFKRLSVKVITENFVKTVKRFPLPVLFSALTAVLIIIEIENFSYFNRSHLIEKSIFISILGFFMTLVSSLYTEKRTSQTKGKYIFNLIAVLLLVYLFFTLPEKFRETDYIIFANFLSASLFALMFVYTEKENDKYFGIYNITLFMRAFTSFVFAVILFLGLASAVFAVQELLVGDNFHHEIYGDIWAVVAAFFAPVFFLGGLPVKNEPDTETFIFPKALKVLLQFILIPLVSLYLLILYSYAAKIIFTRVWPEGIVSYLIISYSLVGIVAIILLSPLKDDENFAWTKTFSKYFFRALLPLIIVLFMAVFKRIGQYGVTEKRYFILILAFWLAGAALYMVFGKKKNLKLLPVTLSIISVLSLYGPWSCFSVSLRSQRDILKDLLTVNGIFVDGKIVSAEKEIPFADRKSISSIVSYFYDNHGIGKLDYLNPLYEKLKAETDDEIMEKYHYYRDKNEQVPRRMLVQEGFGFEFVNAYQTQNSLDYINVALKYSYDPVLEDISGYGRMIDCTDNIFKKPVFDEGYSLYIRHDSNKVIFSKDSLSELFSIDLKLHTDEILKNIKNPMGGNQLGPEEMTVREENDSLKYMIAFRNFNLKRKNENEIFQLSSSHFRLYYTIK